MKENTRRGQFYATTSSIGATSSLQHRDPSNQYTDLNHRHGAPTTNATKNKGKNLNQLPHSQIYPTQDEGLITSAAKTAAKSVATKSATRSLEPEDVFVSRQQPNTSSSASECRNRESEHTSSGHLQPYTSSAYPRNLRIGIQFVGRSAAQSLEGEQLYARSLEIDNQSTAQSITRILEVEHTSRDHMQAYASSTITRKKSSR